MRRLLFLLALPLAVLLMQCTSPSMERQLKNMEAKQDSIIRVLATMQEKHEFMAMRMGWRPPPDTTPKSIPLGTSYIQGPETAKLTIVEFTDLQCPYCAQVAPVLDSVAHAFPGDVRIVFKHFPLSFHPQAKPAAAAALAAGRQGKFFEFRYRVAPHFKVMGDSLYLAVAKELGLDMDRFKQEMALTPESGRIIEDDIALGRKLGVEGTPTVFVNGRLAQDRSFEYFSQLVRKIKAGG